MEVYRLSLTFDSHLESAGALGRVQTDPLGSNSVQITKYFENTLSSVIENATENIRKFDDTL